MKKFCVSAVALVMVLGLGLGSVFSQEPREIDIMISPNTINLNSDGEWVTVHADIPLAGVLTASLELNGVVVNWTKADAQLDLVAKFVVDEVKGIVSPPSATLKLVGEVMTPAGPVAFSGSDTIKVVKAGKE